MKTYYTNIRDMVPSTQNQSLMAIALSKIFGFSLALSRFNYFNRVYLLIGTNIIYTTLFEIESLKFHNNMELLVYEDELDYKDIIIYCQNYILENKVKEIVELIIYCKDNGINIPNYSDDVKRIIEVTLSGNHKL